MNETLKEVLSITDLSFKLRMTLSAVRITWKKNYNGEQKFRFSMLPKTGETSYITYCTGLFANGKKFTPCPDAIFENHKKVVN